MRFIFSLLLLLIFTPFHNKDFFSTNSVFISPGYSSVLPLSFHSEKNPGRNRIRESGDQADSQKADDKNADQTDCRTEMVCKVPQNGQ